MTSKRPAAVLPDITVQQLTYLDAVATCDTWAQAAATVGVSASALSQGLAELERRVGVRLFERDGRRRVLRPEATTVLAHARRVLAATHDLAVWADEVAVGHAGRLRVGMIDAAAVHWFGDDLRRFVQARPNLDLRLTVTSSAALLDDLTRGELDLVVCVAPTTTPEGVTVTPLLSEPLLVHLPADTDPGVIHDRARWGPWVTFPAGAHTREVIEQALTRAGASFEVVADSHQPEVLREMVALGVGWAVLPRSAGAHRHRRIRTVQGDPLAHREVVAAHRHTGGAAAVADLVEELSSRRHSENVH